MKYSSQALTQWAKGALKRGRPCECVLCVSANSGLVVSCGSVTSRVESRTTGVTLMLSDLQITNEGLCFLDCLNWRTNISGDIMTPSDKCLLCQRKVFTWFMTLIASDNVLFFNSSTDSCSEEPDSKRMFWEQKSLISKQQLKLIWYVTQRGVRGSFWTHLSLNVGAADSQYTYVLEFFSPLWEQFNPGGNQI